MPMEMPLVIEPAARSRARNRYDIVSLERDQRKAVHLRFIERGKVGRQGSREITLEPEIAEALLVMLSRELDSDDDF